MSKKIDQKKISGWKHGKKNKSKQEKNINTWYNGIKYKGLGSKKE
jgi:hypothetical protein